MSDRWWDEKNDEYRELSLSLGKEYSDLWLEESKERAKQYAYCELKESTGQDFGWDLAAWEEWLRQNTKAFDY